MNNYPLVNQASRIQLEMARSKIQAVCVMNFLNEQKTSYFSLNLAAAVAERHLKVLFLDLIEENSVLDDWLGFDKNVNLTHFLQRKLEFKEVLFSPLDHVYTAKVKANIDEIRRAQSLDYFERIKEISKFQFAMDYLMVHVSNLAMSIQEIKSILPIRERVVIISDEQKSQLACFETLKKMFIFSGSARNFVIVKSMNEYQGRIIFNRFKKISQRFLSLDLDFLGSFSPDNAMLQAQEDKTLFLKSYPGSSSSISVRQLAKKMMLFDKSSTISGLDDYLIEICGNR